jgi:hypothetical protein
MPLTLTTSSGQQHGVDDVVSHLRQPQQIANDAESPALQQRQNVNDAIRTTVRRQRRGEVARANNSRSPTTRLTRAHYDRARAAQAAE